MKPLFITGIGTGVGKTLVAALVAAALKADYWKPVQAGTDEGTDTETVANWLGGFAGKFHQEVYKLKLPASPHLAAAEEGLRIDLDEIARRLPATGNNLVIEGAGGLFVPLNEKEFVCDLIKKLDAQVILVSRNYLGSINHSLLTAAVCREQGLSVLGWIFNDDYMQYEEEIARWSNYPVIAKLPHLAAITPETIHDQASRLKEGLNRLIQKNSV
ncbi:MAG: dethiobiotin synthase [Williamsia sp.]|nr:dethiobiotin synthase [Williamsia sp.]